VEEMQFYFSFFFHHSDHFAKKQGPKIFPDIVLEALLTLSREEFTPNYFIDFPPCSSNDFNRLAKGLDGSKEDSFMDIPSVLFPTVGYPSWPPQKGYTATSWFKIETMPQHTLDGSITSSICLFSFATKGHEQLIDAVINQDMYFSVKLYVDCGDDVEGEESEKTNKYEVVFHHIKFDCNKWYYIALNHNLSNLNNQIVNTFTLYVNGYPQGTCIVEYEDTSYLRIFRNMMNVNSASLSTICLGCSLYNTTTYLAKYGQRKSKRFSLFGWNRTKDEEIKEKRPPFKTRAAFQMGNLYIIEECLSASDVYLMYHMGPNYTGTFEDASQYLTREMVNAKRQEVVVLEEPLKHLTDRVILAFSASDRVVATRLSVSVAAQMNTFEIEPKVRKSETIRLKKDYTFHDNFLAYIPTNRGDALYISRGVSIFTAVPALLTGSSAVIGVTTFKTSLFSVGGMSSVIGLFNKLDDTYLSVYELQQYSTKREMHKIIVLELLAYLSRYNAQNTADMYAIDGYDQLNNILLQHAFPITDAILLAMLKITGLNIPHEDIIYIGEHGFSKSDAERRRQIRNICGNGVVNNGQAFQKLFLDNRIWAEAPLLTQRNMFETLAFLVSYEHPNALHHVDIYHTAGTLKKTLFTLSQSFIQKKEWDPILIHPLINILRNIAQKDYVNFLLVIGRYIVMTHPIRGISVWDQVHREGPDPRRSVIQLFLSFMRKDSADVLEYLHNVLPVNIIIALLENRSYLTRTVLLKVIGVYITKKESLHDDFKRHDGVYMLTEQLKQFNPSLLEMQVLFDLLVGSFYNDTEDEEPVEKVITVETKEEIEEEIQLDVHHDVMITPPRRSRTKSEFVLPKIGTSSPMDLLPSSTVNALLLEDDRTRPSPKRLSYFDDLLVDTPPRETRHTRSLTLGNVKKPKFVKVQKEEPTLTLLVNPVEHFKYPEFLYSIFQLVPCIELPFEKLHILETLYFLFRNGGYAAKKSFTEINTHYFLQSYLSKLIHQQDENFMKCSLDFLTDYLNFTIFELDKETNMGKIGLDYLDEVLQGLLVLEGEHQSWFVQNLQRSLLHGIMIQFQKEHLFVSASYDTPRGGASKKDKKRRKNLDSVFAKFCARAVDYIVQWSYLPPATPHRTVSMVDIADDFSEEIIEEPIYNDEESDFDSDEESKFKVDVINDYISQADVSNEHSSGTSPPMPSMSVYRKIEFDLTGRTESELDEMYTDCSAKARPSASIWYAYEKKKLMNVNKDKRKLGTDPYNIGYDQIAGFIYWFVESIRLCLQHRKGANTSNFEFYGIMSNSEFLLIEPLKRMLLYLADFNRSTAENIFALLNLLYFYPLDSTTTIVQLIKNNDLSSDADELTQISTSVLPCGKIIEDFASDEKFIKRLIFHTSKLFSKPNSDPLLVHLNRKVSLFQLYLPFSYGKSFSTLVNHT
jgi:hypothetical protein